MKAKTKKIESKTYEPPRGSHTNRHANSIMHLWCHWRQRQQYRECNHTIFHIPLIIETTKKTTIFMMAGLMVLGLLSACKKDNNNGNLNLDGICFKATTESHDPNAKTYLDGEDVKWMQDDRILVCNSADLRWWTVSKR